MGTNEISLLVEQFPDGEYEIPLTHGEGGPEIGVAFVTFKNGSWTALLVMEGDEAKALGLDLTYVHKTDPIHGLTVSMAIKVDDEEREN